MGPPPPHLGITKPAKPINACMEEVPGTHSALEALGNIDPDVLIELLSRKERDDGVVPLMGCAPKCTPSVRRASCQPHCTQVSCEVTVRSTRGRQEVAGRAKRVKVPTHAHTRPIHELFYYH